MLKNKILATTLSVSLLAPLANPIFENAKAANDTEDIGKGSDIEIIKRTEGEFEITYGRNMDVTHAIKRSTHYGNSYLDGHRIHNAFKNRNYTVKYEVNWKTHEIKVKG
nr:leukocidin family pore-forming toxin [Staphylococcus aureus]